MTHLDGNACAGTLADLFGEDVTLALGRCAGCGHHAVLAEVAAYVTAMGTVLRCAPCQAVLAVLVTTASERVVDLTGLSPLRLAAPGDRG
ncbi:DUF6510 family protein [Desertihabitans aurantiacus]|uniref:DUF6510 family protein n=1 Tax=Desertihabitans aurantiacus TaxID=2282477 RepID=UPI000DF820D8|nr:DUF6510 family protein [Desertihabitans aurantiacus]